MALTLEALRRVSIFSDLQEAAAVQILGRFQIRGFKKDGLIVSQDDPGDALFVLMEGRVKVVLYGENGREIILKLLNPGDFFGEMSILDGERRSANVLAMEQTTVCVLSRDDFIEHLRDNPDTAFNILGIMSRRLRHADQLIGNLTLLDVYARLAQVLIDLANEEKDERASGHWIQKRPTHQDLANMIGTSRETVSRALGEFQRRGLLQIEGKSLILNHTFVEQNFSEFD